MNSLNLYEYIKSGQILKNLETDNPFDVIVYEDKGDKKFPENMNVKTLEELGFEFGYSGALSGICQKYKNVLLIIDSLSYIYFLPFLRNISETNVTIINLSSGISGLLNKHSPDLEDIPTLKSFNAKVYEPYDFLNFFEILEQSGNKYIRVTDKEISQNIVQGNEDTSLSKEGGLLSLTEFGITGISGTVLVGGYLLQEAIGGIGRKMEEENFSYDMFTIFDYDFTITEELLSSLQKTEKLYVISDQKENKNFENDVKAKLREKGIMDIETIFIYPQTQNTTTLLKDHLFEQAELDGERLYEKL